MIYLLDTNAAIDYIGGDLTEKATAWLDGIIETEVALSVINQIEMLGFNTESPEDLLPFEEIAATLRILPLDMPVVTQCIAIRKQFRIKLPDAIVASTALVHGLSLITRNEADFKRIPELRLINPHNL